MERGDVTVVLEVRQSIDLPYLVEMGAYTNNENPHLEMEMSKRNRSNC